MDKSDPFTVLQLPYTATWRMVKMRYNEASRVAHPDKGGNPYVFNKINVAYKALEKIFKQSQDQQLKEKFNKKGGLEQFKKHRSQDYQDNVGSFGLTKSQVKQMSGSKKFNQMYEQNRQDHYTDNGYGDMWTGDDATGDSTGKDLVSYAREKQLNVYAEPEALADISDNYESIGGAAAMNFSDRTMRCGSGGGYTDLVEAFTDSVHSKPDPRFTRGISEYTSMDKFMAQRDADFKRDNSEHESEMMRRREVLAAKKERMEQINTHRHLKNVKAHHQKMTSAITYKK